MDVRLPDGTIISGVPDGTTKADLIAKLSRNGYDVSKLGDVGQPSGDQTKGWSTYQPGGTTNAALGVGVEGAKGLLRGAANTADAVKAGALGMLPGGAAINALSKFMPTMGRQAVVASPATPTEQFAGTTGEVVGGLVAGGGAGTPRNAVVAGGAGLGAATGEQVGGDVGKFLGMLAGTYGTSAAVAIARKIGVAAKDIAAVFGAGFGNQAGIERLASKAATAKAGADAPRIIEALKTPTQYVKGSPVTAGEAITEAQMGKPEQFGGAVVRMQKDLYGAQGIENVLPTVAKQQADAIAKHSADFQTKAAPMREIALGSANAGRFPRFDRGIRAEDVTSKIDEFLAQPGKRASDVVVGTLNKTKEKINSIAKDGVVDAEDIYTVRKEIGTTIGKFSKENQQWDRKLTGGLERDVQKVIDDAIEAAGGVGWKKYLATERQGYKAIEMQQDRLKAMKLLQAQVKGSSAAQVVSGEILHPPTLLNRPMMLANYALKFVAKDANSPVVKRVAEAMRNSEDFAALIKLPRSHPDRVAMQYIVNYMVATKMDQAAKELTESTKE